MKHNEREREREKGFFVANDFKRGLIENELLLLNTDVIRFITRVIDERLNPV